MGVSDHITPSDHEQMLLADIRDDIRGLCAFLRGGAEAKPVTTIGGEPLNLVETTVIEAPVEIPVETPAKQSTPDRKPPVKKRRPVAKKKPATPKKKTPA